MDARDKYDALEWAIAALASAWDDPISKLYLQHLRAMRDDAKREAGR